MNLKEMLEKRAQLAAEVAEMRKAGIDKLDADKRQSLGQKLNDIEELDASIGMESRMDALSKQPKFNIPKDKESREYSLANVLRSINGHVGCDIGYEREVSQELCRNSGMSASGIMVPLEQLLQRAATTTTEAAPVIGKQTMTPQGALYMETILSRLGAQTITGLSANIDWPAQIGDLKPDVKGETAANSEKNLEFKSIMATPHRVGADYPISMQTLLQNSVSLETVLVNEMNTALLTKIEDACFNGSGVNGDVLGILNNPSIGSFTNTGGTLTWANAIAAKKKLIGIGLDQAGMGWALGSDAWAKASTTLKADGVSGFVLNEGMNGDTIAGYKTAVSDIMGAGNAIAGYWRNVYLQYWGGIDIYRNESSHRGRGMIVFNLNTFFDITCTRPGKLLKNTVTIA